MNSQSVLTEIPGNGLEPGLQGVLATKIPRTEEVPGLFCCEQQFITIKNNKEAVKTNLSCVIDFNFTKSYLPLIGRPKNLHLIAQYLDER